MLPRCVCVPAGPGPLGARELPLRPSPGIMGIVEHVVSRRSIAGKETAVLRRAVRAESSRRRPEAQPTEARGWRCAKAKRAIGCVSCSIAALAEGARSLSLEEQRRWGRE